MPEYYETFVQRIIETETPSMEKVLRARQQFIDECDENELQEQLIYCLQPFVDKVTEEQVPWWGLLMCGLFEVHIAARELGVAE